LLDGSLMKRTFQPDTDALPRQTATELLNNPDRKDGRLEDRRQAADGPTRAKAPSSPERRAAIDETDSARHLRHVGQDQERREAANSEAANGGLDLGGSAFE